MEGKRNAMDRTVRSSMRQSKGLPNNEIPPPLVDAVPLEIDVLKVGFT